MQKKPIVTAGAIAFEKTPFALRYKGLVSLSAIFVAVVLVAMPFVGVVNDGRIVFGGMLFMLTGGALFKFWVDRTGKELPLRQLLQWKGHIQNPPREMQNLSAPLSKSYFLDTLRAYPVEAFVMAFEERRFHRAWEREEVSAAIVAAAKKYVFNEDGKSIDIPFVENFIVCLRSLERRIPFGEKERIRSDFIHEIAEWVAFDPKNWNFGKDLRKALKKPSLARADEDEARLFPAFAASFFVSKTPQEFVSTLRVLSEEGRDSNGVMGMAELGVAKMFLGLLCNAPEMTELVPKDAIRFERLFVASQSWWKPRQIEQAVEICLTGRFGPEIAKFAVPFVRYGELSKPKSQTTPLGMIRGMGEAPLVRRFLRSDGFHPDAVARASVIFYDLGETSDVAKEFAGVCVMPSPEDGKKRK